MKYQMKKTWGVFALFLLVASANAQAVTIIYSRGHDIDTVAAALGNVELAAGNPVAGFADDDLADVIGDGNSGIYGAYDALVLGEDYYTFDAGEQAIIANFTSNGGHTVVLGAHGAEVAFLNATFGYSVTHFAASSSDKTPIHRVAGDGPQTLLALNGSWFVESAPPTVLYQREGGGDAAFVDTFGAGTVSWLAWDFCACSGVTDEEQADWFSLLSTAAIRPPVAAEPVPSLSDAMLAIMALVISLTGLAFVRRTS